MNLRRNRLLTASGILAAALVLAGCSTPAPTDEGTDAPDVEVADITVAVYPVMSNAAVYIGVNEGIFEEHGLNVTLTPITSGPDSVPLLLSGDLTFTSIDVPTLINANKEDRKSVV